MPYADLGAVRLHYTLGGPEGQPVVVFSHSLGADLRMWDEVAGAVAGRYRILRYDTRGHGKSGAPSSPYKLAELGYDLLTLLDALHIESCSFCGLSLGGITGIWLGAYAPDRIEKLILANTAARIGAVDGWNTRIDRVKAEGLEPMADETLDRWFTPGFRASAAARVESIRKTLVSTSAEGYANCCAALRDADLSASLPGIQIPTLVIAGAADPATPPSQGRELAQKLQQAEYLELPCAHISAVEQAGEFSRAAMEFLDR